MISAATGSVTSASSLARGAVAAGQDAFCGISLHRCGFGCPGACGIAIAAFAGYLCSVTTLILSCNHISDTGAVELAESCHYMPNLEERFLDLNLLGCGAAQTLALVVMEGSLSKINQLRLDNNHIRDTGSTALFNMLTTTATLPELHVFTMHKVTTTSSATACTRSCSTAEG